MAHVITPSYTSFSGFRRIVSGSLLSNALAIKGALESGDPSVLLFDDSTGRSCDIDTRGSVADVLARFADHSSTAEAAAEQAQQTTVTDAGLAVPVEPRGRGRPRLGVVAREVTLLPRHWEWLAEQPGGASVALRRLVEEARRSGGDAARVRQRQERSYHFMLALAGNLAGFEEATRALFAQDLARFSALIASWPPDVRDHAIALACVS